MRKHKAIVDHLSDTKNLVPFTGSCIYPTPQQEKSKLSFVFLGLPSIPLSAFDQIMDHCVVLDVYSKRDLKWRESGHDGYDEEYTMFGGLWIITVEYISQPWGYDSLDIIWNIQT